ncbi:MAG: hypothetical protein OEW62_08545 [Candidatus Bathyarchaeota archaeon]|nr:hypothetical protein [Candidatus Bathyarchaeota archaeon]
MKKIVSRFALLPVLCTRIIPLLLFSALVGTQFVNLAAANFMYPPEPDTPDTNPPTISILSPENKTYTVNNISLTFGLSKHIYEASYSLDGQANVTIGNIPLVHGIGTFGNITLIGLPDGMHSLVVYARDETGNRGSSEMIYFSIAKEPEPFPTTWVETAVVSVTVVGLGFIVYFAKVKKTSGVNSKRGISGTRAP